MSLKNASVLIIDDDVDVLTAVRLLLKPEVKEVVTEKNPENIRIHFSQANFRCDFAGYELQQFHQYRQ